MTVRYRKFYKVLAAAGCRFHWEGNFAPIIAVQVNGPVASEQPFTAAQAVVRHLEYAISYAYK